MKNDKVVIVIENAIDVTGSLLSAVRSAALLKDNWRWEFILPQRSRGVAKIEHNGFVVHQLPMRELSRGIMSLIVYLPMLVVNTIRLFNLIKRRTPSMLVNNDFYNLLPALATMFGSRVPYVCYVRFMPSRFPKPLVKIWYGLHSRYATKVIAVSESVKNELPSSRNVVVVYNELPNNDIVFRASTSSVILYPANYISGKGQEFALEAFHLVSNAHLDWTLRFVGGDMGLAKNNAFKKSLVIKSEQLGIAERIEWMDFSDDLSKHYEESSFVLNFSDSESFSLTTLEAQFYGRPVIVTRCGGPEEIIIDGQTGYLVPRKDITAMAASIEYLITHTQLRHEMGARAFTHVRDKFSSKNTIDKLAGIYLSAIKN